MAAIMAGLRSLPNVQKRRKNRILNAITQVKKQQRSKSIGKIIQMNSLLWIQLRPANSPMDMVHAMQKPEKPVTPDSEQRLHHALSTILHNSNCNPDNTLYARIALSQISAKQQSNKFIGNAQRWSVKSTLVIYSPAEWHHNNRNGCGIFHIYPMYPVGKTIVLIHNYLHTNTHIHLYTILDYVLSHIYRIYLIVSVHTLGYYTLTLYIYHSYRLISTVNGYTLLILTYPYTKLQIYLCINTCVFQRPHAETHTTRRTNHIPTDNRDTTASDSSAVAQGNTHTPISNTCPTYPLHNSSSHTRRFKSKCTDESSETIDIQRHRVKALPSLHNLVIIHYSFNLIIIGLIQEHFAFQPYLHIRKLNRHGGPPATSARKHNNNTTCSDCYYNLELMLIHILICVLATACTLRHIALMYNSTHSKYTQATMHSLISNNHIIMTPRQMLIFKLRTRYKKQPAPLFIKGKWAHWRNYSRRIPRTFTAEYTKHSNSTTDLSTALDDANSAGKRNNTPLPTLQLHNSFTVQIYPLAAPNTDDETCVNNTKGDTATASNTLDLTETANSSSLLFFKPLLPSTLQTSPATEPSPENYYSLKEVCISTPIMDHTKIYYINLPQRHNLPIRLDPLTTTIGDLKTTIHNKFNIPTHLQILHHNNHKLIPSHPTTKTLHDLNINTEDTIAVGLLIRGGANPLATQQPNDNDQPLPQSKRIRTVGQHIHAIHGDEDGHADIPTSDPILTQLQEEESDQLPPQIRPGSHAQGKRYIITDSDSESEAATSLSDEPIIRRRNTSHKYHTKLFQR